MERRKPSILNMIFDFHSSETDLMIDSSLVQVVDIHQRQGPLVPELGIGRHCTILTFGQSIPSGGLTDTLREHAECTTGLQTSGSASNAGDGSWTDLSETVADWRANVESLAFSWPSVDKPGGTRSEHQPKCSDSGGEAWSRDR